MKRICHKSCFMLCCLFFIIFSIFFLVLPIDTQGDDQVQDAKQIWQHNCALRDKYWNELIFTATQSGDTVSMVAENRAAYVSVFEGLLLKDEPKIESRRDKILKMVSKAPGEHTVIISAELDREVDKLWRDIIKKGQSHGIECK